MKKLFSKKNSASGFTLVELIVVLVIVAILAAVAVPTFLAFIDMGKEKELKNNAEKCLASTRAALNEIYSDAGSSFSPAKRDSVRSLADPDKNSTEFIVWTKSPLDAKSVRAVPDYIASYTVEKALYAEAGYYFAFNSKEWKKFEGSKAKENALAFLSADDSKAIYMWPYKQDMAYFPTIEDEDIYGDDDSDTVKVVNLNLDSELLNYAYFSSKGGNDNSGMKSMKVVFWKEIENGSEKIKSTWEIEGSKNIFKYDDNTEFELHVDDRIPTFSWEHIKGNAIVRELADYNAIKNYIYDPSSTDKVYDFRIKIDKNAIEDFPIEDVYISKSAFSGVLSNTSSNITVVVKKGMSDYKNEKLIPSNAVRIDDKSVQDGFVFAWYEGNTFCWWTNASNVYMPADCSSLLKGKTKVQNFNFSGFDFSKVTNMSEMFADNPTLQSVTGIGSTGPLTNVSRMYANCSALTMSDNSGLTGNISSLNSMYEGCSSITTIEFPDTFNTSGATSFEKMFKNCSSATDINVSGLNVSSGKNFDSMFEGCSKVTSLNVTSWSLRNAVSMNATFKGCVNLSNMETDKLVTSRQLKELKETFAGCYRMSSIDLSGFNAGGVTTCEKMFSMREWKDDSDFANNSLTTITFKAGFDTYNTTNMSGMFEYCTKLSAINGLENLRTDNVKDMSYMFAHNNSIKELKLTSFDTSKVTNCEGMFEFDTKNNSLTKIKASSKFVIKTNTNQKIFGSSEQYIKLTGSRKTTASKVKADDPNGFDSALYARVDGQDGIRGYFYEDYKKVTVKKDSFQSLFANVIVANMERVETSKYSLSEVQYLPGVVDIRDTNGGKDYYVFAWREVTGSENGKDVVTVKWWSNAEAVYLPADCKKMFIENKYEGMRYFSFEGFDVSKVTTMQSMFENKPQLTKINFGNMFYPDALTTTYNIFYRTDNLDQETLDFYDTFKKP